MVKNLIFDLDGTLLDTLPDIARAINDALKQEGYEYSFSIEESKTLIGGGADRLVKKALKDKGDDEKAFAALKKTYMPLYKAYQNDTTKPFDGLLPVLSLLKSEGRRLFVVSNKPDPLAQEVVKRFFPPLFDGVTGQKEGDAPKPDPTSTLRMMEQFQMNHGKTLYIGDSRFDIETAHNASLRSVLVTWGYGFYTSELLDKSDFVVASPGDLYTLVSSL